MNKINKNKVVAALVVLVVVSVGVFYVVRARNGAGSGTITLGFIAPLPDYDGTVGTYHFDSNGDVVGVGFANFTLENGQEVPLAE